MTNAKARENASLHVILGAGQVGARLAERLVAGGHRVRVVRKGSAAASAGIETVSGDMTNLTFAEAATHGAAVVYDCMNPPYDQWPTLLLPMARGALHGATRAGAKLVALDCLYMYGRPSAPMTEDTPNAPCSKKGTLRVELSHQRLDAHRRGEVPVAIARASDFFGPNLPYSAWGDRFFERVFAGKRGECLGDPDMPHAYTYVEDVVTALATLGTADRDDAFGSVWHVPTAPAESTRAIAKRLGRALGRDIDLMRAPKLVLRGLGLSDPTMREMVEMTYQWEAPFELDSSRFERTFGVAPTSLDDAITATASWAKGRFSAAA